MNGLITAWTQGTSHGVVWLITLMPAPSYSGFQSGPSHFFHSKDGLDVVLEHHEAGVVALAQVLVPKLAITLDKEVQLDSGTNLIALGKVVGDGLSVDQCLEVADLDDLGAALG